MYVNGVTIRDLCDALIRAYVLSHTREPANIPIIDQAMMGQLAEIDPNSLYSLEGSYDIIAVLQNFSCEIEKILGIYPNIKID